MSKNLGLLIKRYRLARNMTQKDLAKSSGVSSSTISKLESGNYIPTIRLLEKILNYMPTTSFFNSLDFFVETDLITVAFNLIIASIALKYAIINSNVGKIDKTN